MPAGEKKIEIYERDGSRSSTLRGRGNSRSPKRKIAVDNAIRACLFCLFCPVFRIYLRLFPAGIMRWS